ncbi:MAG TPA: YMGG-like glycine zipper-containing protein [Stellaceae bacterium]
MRRARTGALALGMLVCLSACAEYPGPDPNDAAQRMVGGAVWGAALGSALGAAFAINPGIGAPMGAATGAALGTLAGLLSAQQAVYYAPIAPPTAAVIPGFYDAWAPGSHPPPLDAMAPPPRSGNQG